MGAISSIGMKKRKLNVMDRAKKATYVEGFEIAECGKQITDRGALTLFPMLDPLV